MIYSLDRFVDQFGVEPPAGLIDLLNNESIRQSLPMDFYPSKVGFLVGVQYFVDIFDPLNFDVNSQLLRFAVTPDGYDLLLDINDSKSEIIQREHDELDTFGVTVLDLLDSSFEC